MTGTFLKRIFAFLLLAAAMTALPSGSQASAAEAPSGAIESFEIVTLRLSGMRFTSEYEIVMKGEEAEVTEYGIRYEKNEDKRVPEERTVCSTDKVLKLLNDCELLAWDGFVGPHPKDVRDGIMFSLKATVNGGRNIYAHGSENFPQHFREFRNGLNALLRQK